MRKTTMKPIAILFSTLCLWSMSSSLVCAVQDNPPSQSEKEKVSHTANDDAAISMQDALALAEGIADETDPDIATDMLEQLRSHLIDLQIKTPDDPWLLYLNAQLLTLTGQRGDAITQLRRFIQTREGQTAWQAHRDLGDLFVAEFPQLAKASYEKAAQLTANESSVLYGLSLCAAKLGRRTEAIDYAQRAAAAKSTVKCWTNLATLTAGEKQWDQAISASTKALKLAQENAIKEKNTQSSLIVIEAQLKHVIDILQTKFQELSATNREDALQLAALYRQRAELIRKIILYDGLKSL